MASSAVLSVLPGFSNEFTYQEDRILTGYSDSTWLKGKEVPLKHDSHDLGNLIKGIADFTRLPKNWDGYEAIPLQKSNFSNATFLITLLSRSSIRKISDYFPNANGTLTIEWENSKDEKVSVEVGGSTFSYYVKLDAQSPLFFNGNTFTDSEITKLDSYTSRI
jgi:hypothetical protein